MENACGQNTPRLAALNEIIKQKNKEIDQVTEDLEIILNRMLGSIPKTHDDAKKTEASEGVGAIASIENSVACIITSIEKLKNEVKRLVTSGVV